MFDFSSKRAIFLCSAFNGLSQKVWAYFSGGFQKSNLMVGLDAETIHQLKPDLIICPYLFQYIPKEIWTNYPCFIVHPGPPGDGGPNSLNWAVLLEKRSWGVSIIQAGDGWDTGVVWASKNFLIEGQSVAEAYRNQVVDGAMEIIPQAITRFFCGEVPLNKPPMEYRSRIHQQDLAFDWEEDSASILRKINAGDSSPGTIGIIKNQQFRLFCAKKGEDSGEAGEVLQEQDGMVCVGTGDGSLWIGGMAHVGGVKTRPGSLLRN